MTPCAALRARLASAPLLFAGRRVIHWVDNAGSLSHLVNGYASAPDSARLVNMFHIALLALDIEWWGEWVPSKANIADLLTRPDRFEEFFLGMRGMTHVSHDFVLPPLGQDWQSLREWMMTIRNARSEAEAAAAAAAAS